MRNIRSNIKMVCSKNIIKKVCNIITDDNIDKNNKLKILNTIRRPLTYNTYITTIRPIYDDITNMHHIINPIQRNKR